MLEKIDSNLFRFTIFFFYYKIIYIIGVDNMDKVFVFGHKNPDTDSVCGAISLSYLKNKLGLNTEPRILSDINDETKYALNYFNFDTPKYLDDVKVRIKDIKYHKDFYVNYNSSIYDTYNFMNNNNITGIPIVDDEKKYVGYVSLKEIAKSMISDSNNYLNTNFDNIINTLKSTKYIKSTNEIKGNIVSATFDDDTFINNINLDNNSILIVGDRKNIINYAINNKVSLIILIGNSELDKEQVLLIENNKINVITTPYSSFEVSKLLGLTNFITTIKRDENSICLDSDDFMSDFIEISNKTKHTNYPIVSKKGICYGMLRLIDINEYNKYRVILVDHNEERQSVDGLNEADILEIVDHHNISGISTNAPINFRNMSVGSVNTIIYYLFMENNIDIPSNIAGLMLSGILSDTVCLNSPTTTIEDRIVVDRLSSIVNLDYLKYGMDLLKSGMDIKNKTINELVYSDYKSYNINGYKFGIGQLLTVDFNDYKLLKSDIISELNKNSKSNNYNLVVLFITNIINKSSMILYNNLGENVIKEAYNIDNINEGIIIEGILSRKKQIVPKIMNVFEK